MNSAIFWELISRLGDDLQPNRLGTALSALPTAHFRGFGWHLHQAAEALDTPMHREFAVGARQHDLPVSGRPGHPSGDAPDLRELQLTVVALGREVWEAVAESPCLLQASWPCDLGRQVEAVAARRPLRREDLAQGA